MPVSTPSIGEAFAALVALPLAVTLGGVVHAGAHTLAALAVGRAVDGVGALTGALERADEPLVALAPTLAWAVLVGGVATVGALARPSFPVRMLVLFGVALPLLDASWAAAGFFLGFPGADWSRALHGQTALLLPFWALYVVVLSEVGWMLVRRAFVGRVSPRSYTVAFLAVLVVPWASAVGAIFAR